MSAFRQFLASDVYRACQNYISNHNEMLQYHRNKKILKLMSRTFFPKKTEAAAIAALKNTENWEPNLEQSLKLEKVNKLMDLCLISSTDKSVTLDEEYADLLHLFFQKCNT